MKEGIIPSLLIGLVIFSIYLNIINKNFSKFYKVINQRKNFKLTLISIFLIFSPLIIWVIIWLFFIDHQEPDSSIIKEIIKSDLPPNIKNAFLSAFMVFKEANSNIINTTRRVNIPIPIQSVLLSILLSSLISWWITSQRNKTQLVFDLHTEFNTKEMYEARNKADIFLKNTTKKTSLKEIRDELFLKDTDPKNYLEENYIKVFKKQNNNQDNNQELLDKIQNDIQNIFLVIRFYERLGIAIKNNQLNTKLVPKLFGELFYWWYINCYEDRLLPIKEWELSQKIKDLKDWMDCNTTEGERKKWVEMAQQDKDYREK